MTSRMFKIRFKKFMGEAYNTFDVTGIKESKINGRNEGAYGHIVNVTNGICVYIDLRTSNIPFKKKYMIRYAQDKMIGTAKD